MWDGIGAHKEVRLGVSVALTKVYRRSYGAHSEHRNRHSVDDKVGFSQRRLKVFGHCVSPRLGAFRCFWNPPRCLMFQHGSIVALIVDVNERGGAKKGCVCFHLTAKQAVEDSDEDLFRKVRQVLEKVMPLYAQTT